MNEPRFLSEALAEYEDAAVYYELKQPGLGARFLHDVDDALALASEFPEAAQLEQVAQRRDVRSRSLPSFPLRIRYTVRDDTILVVAVFHGRRRPGYWHQRLQPLDEE